MSPDRQSPHRIKRQKQRETSLLGDIWNSTTRPLRLVASSIAGFGLILLAIGIAGDANDWFSSLPFLTNILSGITSACFGIPLALVFLQWLTSLQSEELRKRSIMRLRIKLSKEFHTSICAPARSGRFSDLEKLYDEYTKMSQPWQELVETLDDLARSSGHEYYSTEHIDEDARAKKARVLLSEYLDKLQAASELTREVLAPEPKNWQTRVRTQWETLESSLRNESLQAGLNWIPAELETEIEALMADIDLSRMYAVWDVSQTMASCQKSLHEPWSTQSIMGIQASGFVPGFAVGYTKQLHDLMVYVNAIDDVLSHDR
ncbi:hypothetical protein [Amycolatopsis sp. NPDC003731]